MRHTGILVIAIAAALSAACASTGAVPKPFPMPGAPAAANPSPPPGTPGDESSPNTPDTAGVQAGATAIVQTALDLRGIPYRNGGDSPKGFDCSGFTQYVFAQEGIALPRSVREQFDAGRPITAPDELQPGDLLFFTTTEPGPSHVAIWLGSGEFVHAPSSNGVVRVERLATRYWMDRYLGARRITQP